jgi:hypothetical protein
MLVNKLNIGDRVKTKLIAFICAINGSENKEPATYYHWWIVDSIQDGIITLKDKENNIMKVDSDGYGIDEYIHHSIYKIKYKPQNK